MEKLNSLKKEVEALIIQGKQRKIYKEVVEATEKRLIEIILERTFGNRLKAAKLLGINRNTLHTKIEKYRINVDYYRSMLD